MEHSIIFPLPFGIHIGFVIASTVLLILCYIRRKYLYELYMLIGVASTMLIYICSEKPLFYILGLEEMILLALTIYDMAKVSRAIAQKEKEEKARREEEHDKEFSGENT